MFRFLLGSTAMSWWTDLLRQAEGIWVVLEDDEGKVRALGQLRVKATTMHGFSYYGQAEMRGGEDYFGVAGKVGLRYDW